jgi:hypothetical protein
MSCARTVAVARAALVVGWIAGCGDDAPDGEADEARYLEVEAASVPEAIVVDASSAAAGRTALLDALDDREGAPSVAGGGPWRTVAMVRAGESAEEAAREGRTYVRHGRGQLKLDVRLGAGDLGGFAGDVVSTGALRAMIEVRVADPETIEGRFRIVLVQDDGLGGVPPRDVTPRFLARALPRGRYRVPVEVPEPGARFVVGVTTLEAGREVVAQAWASPIAVLRPWLQEE